MNRNLTFALILLAASLMPARLAGDVIDRVLALVNGHVILQSHLEDDLCFEALADGRPLHDLAERDRSAALSHLIDQQLVREQLQAGENTTPSPEDVQKRIAQIRALHPAATTDDAWRAELARYGMNEKQLAARVTDELALLRQVDMRLRPSVQVDNSAIEAYYRDVFLPELHRASAGDVPLAEVSPRIREIVTQQKIGEAFTAWLQSLRKESRIRTFIPVDDPSATAGAATR